MNVSFPLALARSLKCTFSYIILEHLQLHFTRLVLCYKEPMPVCCIWEISKLIAKGMTASYFL